MSFPKEFEFVNFPYALENPFIACLAYDPAFGPVNGDRMYGLEVK